MKAITKLRIKKWQRADNYMGEDLSAYYIGPSRSRDSDTLTESNFHVALEMLGGESETVRVARFGHWACGWAETILVHESDKAKVKQLNEIACALENYACLDETDYSERENEAQRETLEFYADQFEGELAEFLKLETLDKFPKKHVRDFIFEVYVYDCGYQGTENAWVSADSIARYLKAEGDSLLKNKVMKAAREVSNG
jgi:hypothetical protein